MNNKIEKIEVFGSGCSSCKKLFELTKEAARELGINIEIEYIEDIQRLMELGLMSFPVLAINGKPIIVGEVPNVKEIKEAMSRHEEIISSKEDSSGCSCGGNC